MNDFLYRGVIDELGVRFSYTCIPNVVNTAILKHNCDPASSHILGRALIAGTLLTPLLGEKERLTIQWNYPKGSLKQATVDVGANSIVRGFVGDKNLSNTADDLTKLYGNKGTVNIVRTNQAKVLQNSTCDAHLHDIVSDLAFYYSLSEQIETEIVALIGFDPNPKKPVYTAQGFLIQGLPDSNLEVIENMRKKMASKKFKNFLIKAPTHNNYFEKIINLLIQDYPKTKYSLYGCPIPRFKCNCSRQRIIEATKVLPIKNLREHLEHKKPLTVTCNICSTIYHIKEDIINQLIKAKEQQEGK